MDKLTYWIGEGDNRYDEQIGMVAFLACISTAHNALPLRYLSDWIAPAVRHRQIMFAFDEHGRRVGYLTWALLTLETERGYLRGERLHESEWNEGTRLWILDFVAPFGHAPKIIEFLKERFQNAHSQAYVVRRNRSGRFYVRTWKRKSR